MNDQQLVLKCATSGGRDGVRALTAENAIKVVKRFAMVPPRIALVGQTPSPRALVRYGALVR